MSQQRVLMRLRDRYPLSRMSLWRLSRQPDFPTGITILGRKYYYSDELDAYEERRRKSPCAAAVTEAIVE
jgi:hypothetical protein